MKKQTARITLFCLLAAASLSAYVFLSVAAAPEGTGKLKPAAGLSSESYDDRAESEEATIALPDIYLLKKLLQAGKQLIPAS